MGLDHLAEQGVVAGESGLHDPGLLLPETRAAFDIGEQECDRAGGVHPTLLEMSLPAAVGSLVVDAGIPQ